MGLMSKKVHLAVKILKNHGVIAAMTMLGNAVFTLTDSPQEVSQLLDYPCIIAKIDNIGARIIEEDHERKNHPKA
jgi:pantoate kinase